MEVKIKRLMVQVCLLHLLKINIQKKLKMAADKTRIPMRRKRTRQRQCEARDCAAAPMSATRMRLVPHRLPASIVCPHIDSTRVRRGSVSQVAATPPTWPAAAAAIHVRVPRYRSAVPPAMIMVTMPRTAVARKLPGTAPTEDTSAHQRGEEGEASRVVK